MFAMHDNGGDAIVPTLARVVGEQDAVQIGNVMIEPDAYAMKVIVDEQANARVTEDTDRGNSVVKAGR